MSNLNFHRATSVALAAFITVLLIACGESDAGLSRADVTDIVRSELANAPAPASQGPSVAEVERIVRDSIADIPEPAPGLTSADVERIVQAAIADIPAPDAMKSMEMAETKSTYAPPRWSPAEYTQYLVKDAIKRYETEGLDATVAYYNTPESIDGYWYVFIGDQDDMMLAHAANPDLVGRPFSYATGPNEYPAGDAVAASADQDGEWFSYTYPNPATGGVESKHSWMVRYDGLLFGSGWYEDGPAKSDSPAYTKAFVQQAINLYDAVGLDDTVAYYNMPESVDGQWYVFIIDEDGYTISHSIPEFIGRDPALRVDATGYFFGDELTGATEAGRWIDYVFKDPNTGEERQKHTWAVRHDGLIFASGWYEQ